MSKPHSSPILLAILTIIALSSPPAYAEYHHVTDCTVCHFGLGGSSEASDCGESANLALIRDEIEWPEGSGSTPTVFGPYVTGQPDYNGVCEVCHQNTKYYRYDGSCPNPPCDQDDEHPDYGSGACDSCHKHAPYEFGHQGTVATGCDPCHGHEGSPGTALSHATHTEGDVPRGPETAMGCSDCHDTENFPHFADDAATLAATTACDGCHSQGGAYDGVAMAKAGWEDGIYEEDGEGQVTLRSGQERWCIGCHDGMGSTFDGAEADNVAGNDSTYGYFVSGHGKYDVFCTSCHDPSMTHMDGDNRTYDAVEDMDGPNGYQQGYRLKSVGAEALYPLLIPIVPDMQGSDYYALCFDCHSSERILYSVENDFINIELEEVNPNIELDHSNYHLHGYDIWDSDKDESAIRDSGKSCPTCHDPHGKKAYEDRATWSMTRGDLGIAHKREVEKTYGYVDNHDYAEPGGDLDCAHCHEALHGLLRGYLFQLGTPPPDAPAFSTTLNDIDSVTSPAFGAGPGVIEPGTSFEDYDHPFLGSQRGLLIDNDSEGVKFPVSNLSNNNNVLYGETIDFWYTPNFTPSSTSGKHVLFHCYTEVDSKPYFIKIKIDNASLVFSIRNGLGDFNYHAVRKVNLQSFADWQANTTHHIVCSWGPASGIRLYIDKVEPAHEHYDPSGHNPEFDADYIGGMIEFPAEPNDYFYIGNRDPASLEDPQPANGIIDDFKIYGYQYQKFPKGLALFSKMGSGVEISTPVIGAGGYVDGGTLFYSSEHAQHVKSAPGWKINFPTSNLNSDNDTIDFWYYPKDETTESKTFFYCEKDGNNKAVIRMLLNRDIEFEIINEGVSHRLKTVTFPMQQGDFDYDNLHSYIDAPWFHIVCTWGEGGMHIYINDREATYEVKNGLSYYDGLWDFGDPETPPLTPANFQIGSRPIIVDNVIVDYQEHADGFIDELRIYGYQADKPELEFAYGPPGYDHNGITISGRVGEVDGVTMNGLPGNPQTRNGYYYATVDSGWIGTVTPTKDGYTFAPPSISYDAPPVTSSMPNQNYTPIPQGINLEVPIEMIDSGISSRATTENFMRSAIRLDEADYDGATYYFEIVAENTDNYDHTVELADISNSHIKSTITVPGDTDVPTRWRSKPFTPNSGNNEYQLRLYGEATENILKVYAARIVVVQVNATRTRIQIPLLSGSATAYSNLLGIGTDTTSATTYTQNLPDGFSLWQKDLSAWGDLADGTPWTLEAVFGSTNGSYPANVCLFNKTKEDNDPGTPYPVTASELSQGNGYALQTVDFATDSTNFDGEDVEQFEVRHRVGDASCESRLARAALYVRLTNLNKGEIYWRLARNGSASSGAINAVQRVLVNTDSYTTPSVYYQSTGRDSDLGTIAISVWNAQTSDSDTSGSHVSSAAIDFPSTTKSLVRTATNLNPDLRSGNRYLASIIGSDGIIVVTSSAFVVTFSELP